MCRLFGFRSIIESQVHTSLIHADNALGSQSIKHPDGWGVAYYIEQAPHVIKSRETALEDRLFQTVSGLLSSQTVLAHIRRATEGRKTVLNTHPFQYGPWVFAHNGHITQLGTKREALRTLISNNLKKFILGDTDSELIFFCILTELQNKFGLTNKSMTLNELIDCTKETLKRIISITGPCFFEDTSIVTQHNYLSFIITNGDCMVAHQGGQPLHYSTYKKSCCERDICPAYSESCEAPTTNGKVNHMIFSSEHLSGNNVWVKMKNHELVGIDNKMNLQFSSLV